ncbi:type II toxin-antitoxin system VapC family toxin [Candidatus Fermentibacteria bacterium]|nr:type II toxin-antitoxin system VapC family toxin [Candidatus Fermentibacteria bacterium]
MNRLAVDASVAAKWFLPEAHSREAIRALDGQWELHAPDLIWAEVGNSIWKRWRRRELSQEEGAGILADFRRFLIEIHPSDLLLEGAHKLATHLGCTMYDSLYAALALRLGCRLLTADRSLYTALHCGSSPVIAHWIGDPLSP